MLVAYLFALGFGASVIGALLMLGGGKDNDADHGDHGDHGDHHAPGAKGDFLRIGPAKVLLSIRFWTFAMAAFGAVGTAATLLGVAAIPTFVAALVTGLGVGSAAGWLFRVLREDRVSGTTSLTTLAGEEATVAVAVRPGARGKVRVQRPSGTIELLATSKDGVAFEAGAKVLIAGVHDGVADVTGVGPVRKVAAPVPESAH